MKKRSRCRLTCKEHGDFWTSDQDSSCPKEAFDNAVAEGQDNGCTVMEVIAASMFLEDMGDR